MGHIDRVQLLYFFMEGLHQEARKQIDIRECPGDIPHLQVDA